jgi:DNA-binding beta-propeller fold protein YncE
MTTNRCAALPYSALVVLAALLAAPLRAQVPAGTLIVTNKSAATATFVELPSGRIVGTVPTGTGPHEIAMDRAGRVAVVTDYGGGGRGAGSTLTVIDVPGRRIARTVPLDTYTRPHGIAFLPGDSLVAVTSESSQNIVLVHVASGAVRRAIPTGARGSHMLTFGRAADRIYTGDMGDHTVSELVVGGGTRPRTFTVPRVPEAIGMPAGGGEVWVGSNGEGVVSVVDLDSGTVTRAAEGLRWPYRITFTPDDETVLIPDPTLNELRFLDRSTRRERGRLTFPEGAPQGLTISPDGRHAFLSLSARDRVAIIDIAARRVIGEVPAGPAPDGVVYLP